MKLLMPPLPAPRWRALSHAALAALAFAAAPQVRAEFDASLLPGVYVDNKATLTLKKNGKFTLKTELCDAKGSSADNPLNLVGSYRVEDNWLYLDYRALSTAAGLPECGAHPLMYLVQSEGNTFLFGQADVVRITNFLHSNVEDIHYTPMHRADKANELVLAAKNWLPPLYAKSLKRAPVSARISALGPFLWRENMTHGDEPVRENYASATINAGANQGLFKGMHLCSPHAQIQTVESVDDDEATVSWTWAMPGGTAPERNLPVSSVCRTR